MSKQIIIAEQHRIAAVFAEDQIQELIVAQGTHQIGDIYLGIVENVLPGIDAAFVNIGDDERNGFIHVTDLGPLRLRRASGAITELLAPKQTVLVQVMKEPTGSKGPRLTGNLSLPGRYLVLMPFKRGVNLSRRIVNEGERSRLRALAILVKPASMGLLVRTEADGVAEEAIIEDLEMLQRQWETIQQEAESTRAPSLLNRDDDFIQRVLRDVYTADVNRIVTDSTAGLKRVKHHLMNWGSGKVPPGLLIDQHQERIPILEYFRVSAAIREALKPRVDLPSGGYIIIEPTEALTVIDVNSGSFTRSATARETVLWTNFEAATEIARQLKLRNLAGVIVVDFIDMDSRRDQLQVLKHFEQVLKTDKARPQIAQLSELGLVELTRKRQGQNVYELFGQSCSHCGGLGHTVYIPGDPLPTSGDPQREEELYYAQVSDARLLETRLPRPVPSSDSGNPPKTWEAPILNSNTEASSPELEPGYGNNRRRRRRNEEGPSRTPFSAPPPELEPVGSSARPTPARPLRDGFSVPSEGPSRFPRRSRVPSKPPEVVTVEMTLPEQEVYAWMGVSPLVLAEQSVEDPRTAVVRVQLPNHEPDSEVIAGALGTQAEGASQGGADAHPFSILPRSDESSPVAALSSEPFPEGMATELQATGELPSPENIQAPEEAESPAPMVETRRRRRRSSSL
jgi:ribonuclease E